MKELLKKENLAIELIKQGKLKEAELLNDRINTLSSIESYVGTYFSKQYVLMGMDLY